MYHILTAFIVLALLIGCAKRETSISVTDPRTGAVSTLEHKSDSRKCGEQKDCGPTN